MDTVHFSFPVSLLYVSGCNVGFCVPLALPGCMKWGHFGGGSTAGPQHWQLPLLSQQLLPRPRDFVLDTIFLMSVKFPWLLSKSITCHIPMIYSLHFGSSFFSELRVLCPLSLLSSRLHRSIAHVFPFIKDSKASDTLVVPLLFSPGRYISPWQSNAKKPTMQLRPCWAAC